MPLIPKIQSIWPIFGSLYLKIDQNDLLVFTLEKSVKVIDFRVFIAEIWAKWPILNAIFGFFRPKYRPKWPIFVSLNLNWVKLIDFRTYRPEKLMKIAFFWVSGAENRSTWPIFASLDPKYRSEWSIFGFRDPKIDHLILFVRFRGAKISSLTLTYISDLETRKLVILTDFSCLVSQNDVFLGF